MILKLKTEKDLNKFYRHIWLYKSIFYKQVIFTTNDDVDVITKSTIEGLNIKKRKDRITYIFDKTCEIIDDKNKGINICGFKNRVCNSHRCLKNKQYKDGCCRLCIYVTDHGCPSKNIACKLFNCSCVTSKYEVYTYKNLKLLKVLSLKNRIIVKHNYFTIREESLKDLYSYSLIYSFLRIVIRTTFNLFKVLRKKRGE